MSVRGCSWGKDGTGREGRGGEEAWQQESWNIWQSQRRPQLGHSEARQPFSNDLTGARGPDLHPQVPCGLPGHGMTLGAALSPDGSVRGGWQLGAFSRRCSLPVRETSLHPGRIWVVPACVPLSV